MLWNMIKVVIFLPLAIYQRKRPKCFARTVDGEEGGMIVLGRIILAREFGVDKSFQGAALKCERS